MTIQSIRQLEKALNASTARVDELCAENERLRGLVASLIDRSFRTADKMNCLNAENAKLRGLVRIMHSELVSCEDNGYICGGHKFDKRVHELGIVVD